MNQRKKAEDPRRDVIYEVDKGCTRRALIEDETVGGKPSFPAELVDRMIKDGLLKLDNSQGDAWVTVSKGGWDFYTAKSGETIELHPPVSPPTDEQLADAARELIPPSLVALIEEVVKARRKFPGNRFLYTALCEEIGELAKAILQKEGPDRVQKEALQVACVAMRLYEEGDPAYDDLTDAESKP